MSKKSYLSCVLLVIAMLCVPWRAGSTVLINENFDSDLSATGGIPAGWNNTKGGADVRWTQYDNGYQDSKCMSFNAGMSWMGTNMLRTPKFVPQATTVLEFWFKNGGNGDLSVKVTTDDGTTIVKTLEEGLKATEWTKRTYELGEFSSTEGGISIVFEGKSTNSYSGTDRQFIDNVVVEDPAVCAQPTGLSVRNLKQTGATLTWALGAAPASPSTYEMEVVRVRDRVVIRKETALQAVEETTELSGLEAETEYEVTLRGNCSAQGYSEKSEVFRFTTLAEAVGVGYVERFDGEATKLPAGVRAVGGVKMVSDTRHGSSGGAIEMKATAEELAMLILPPMNHAGNDMQISVWVYGAKGVGYDIGLIEDVANTATFVPLRDEEYVVETGEKWTEVRLNSEAWGGEERGLSFAIMLPRGGVQTLYVDDVEIVKTPLCPRPEELRAEVQDSTSVRLSWSGKSGVTHKVYVINGKDTIRTRTQDNPAVIGGLEANTSYVAMVSDVCTTTDSSEWSAKVQFKTYCKVQEKSLFVETFNTNKIPECWVQMQTEKGTGEGDDLGNNLMMTDGSGDRLGFGAGIKMNKGKAGSRTALILQPIRVETSGEYDLSFWLKRYESQEYEGEGITVWMNNKPGMEGAQRCMWIAGSHRLEPQVASSDWRRYDCNITLTGTVYIIIEHTSMNGEAIYMDDVEVRKAPTCRAINGDKITIGVPTATDITMTWEGGKSGESQWLVDYELDNGNGVVKDTVRVKGKPEQRFENLLPATDYSLMYRVAAYCGAGDTSEWTRYETEKFRTECAAITTLPWEEGFEGEEFVPRCWTQKQSKKGSALWGSDYKDEAWVRDSQCVTEGTASAKHRKSKSGTQTILATPQIEIAEGKEIYLSFFMYRSAESTSTESVKVWVSDTTTTDKAKEVANVAAAYNQEPVEQEEGWYKYSYRIEGSGVKHVIFEAISQNTGDMYIDDIRVGEKMACDGVERFGIGKVTTNTATIVLNEAEEMEWEVEYGEKGYVPGNGKKLKASGKEVEISNLQSETEYEVRVRRVCDAGESEWSHRVKAFRTKCDPYVVTRETELTEGFENYEENTVLDDAICYSQQKSENGESMMGFKVSGAVLSDYDDTVIAPYQGKRLLRMEKQGLNYTWIFRSVQLTAGVKYEISGWFAQNKTGDRTKMTLGFGKQAEAASVTKVIEPVAIQDAWTRVTGYFSVEESGTYYVGWNVENENSLSIVTIDDLRLREVDCIPPKGATVSKITTNTATIRWQTDEAKSEIKVTTTADVNGTDNVKFTETTAARESEAKGLDANTQYYYYIRSINDKGQMSDWTAVDSFRTECSPFGVPYTWKFEEKESLLCWRFTSMGADGLCEWSEKRGHDDMTSLRLTVGSVRTPQIDVEQMATAMISGWVYVIADKDTNQFAIGVEDVDGTYAELEPVKITETSVWKRFAVPLDRLNEEEFAAITARYVTITSMTEGVNLYFDDVTIMETPKCIAPINIEMSNVTPKSVDIEWESVDTEKSWRVFVKKDGNAVFDTVVKTNPCTITGLEPETTYELTMSAICGESNSSEEVACGSVTTKVADMRMEYVLDLTQVEAGKLPRGWEKGDGKVNDETKTWRRSDDGSTLQYNDNYYSGYSYWGSWTEQWQELLSPVFDLIGETSVELEMVVENNAKARDLIVKLSTDGGETYSELETVTAVEGKQTLTYDLTEHVGKRIRVCLEAHSGTSETAATHLHSFSLTKAPSCRRPQAIKMVAQSGSEITVEIEDSDVSHTTWETVCGTPGFDPDKATPVTVSNGKQHTFDGLKSKSDYQFYARSVCVPDKSKWYGPATYQTTCGEYEVPYNEGFESLNYYTPIFEDVCITILKDNPEAYNPNADIATSNPYDNYTSEGKQGLKLTSSTEDDIYVVLPKMNKPLNTLMLEFTYRHDRVDDRNSPLAIGVLTSLNDISSFVLVETFEVVNKMTPGQLMFNRPSIPDGYITFKFGHTTDFTYYLGIDDIKVTENTACPSVHGVKVLSTDGNSATLTVRADGDAPWYEVAYGAVGATIEECIDTVEYDNDTLTVTGLTKGTSYSAYVRTKCGEKSMSEWSAPVIFSTECNVVELTEEGWQENFDSYNVEEDFPACLNRLVLKDNKYPEIFDYSEVSEPNCLHIKGINAVMLPQFNVDGSKTEVSLHVSGQEKLYIGLTDHRNMDSVKQVFEYEPDYYNSVKVTYDMSQSEQKGRYIVLYTESENADVFVDDVDVQHAPTCFVPRNVKVIRMTDETVTLVWQGAPDATEHEYRVMTPSDTVPGKAAASPYKVENLKANTDYTVQMRAVCGADVTDWSEEIAFKTYATAATVPYDATFENEQDNIMWHVVEGVNSNDRFIVGSDKAGVKEGSKALYISNGTEYKYDGAEDKTDIHYAYRTVSMKAGSYDCSFDWKGVGSASSYGLVFVMPEEKEINAGDYTVFSYEPNPEYMVISEKLREAAEWKKYSTAFDIAEDGIYHVVIGWLQQGKADAAPLSIDNLAIKKAACSTLFDVKATGIASDSAIISFVNYNDVKDVEYVWQKGNETIKDTVTTTSIVLKDLSPETSYTVTLRALCSQESASKEQSITFNTRCIPTIITVEKGYTEDFEDYTQDKSELEGCWYEYRSEGVENWVVRTQEDLNDRKAYGGKGYATLRYSNTVTMIRDFQLEGDKSYEVAFYAKTDSKDGCDVSVVLHNEGKGEILHTQRVADTYTRVTYELYAAKTGAYAVGINAAMPKTGTLYASVDDISITQLAMPSPRNLKVTLTDNTATASWEGTADKYEVQILNSSEEVVNTVVEGETKFEYKGVSPASYYTVRVRATDGENHSNWTETDFVTGCSAATLPFVQNFTDVETEGIPVCWDRESASVGTDKVNTWKVYSVNGNNAMYINTTNAKGSNVILSPQIAIPASTEGRYVLTLAYNVQSETDRLHVAISEDGGQTFADTLLTSGKTVSLQSVAYRMNDYAGKTITIGLISNVTNKGKEEYIHVDNVKIVCLGDDRPREVSICSGTGYKDDIFELSNAETSIPGTRTYENYAAGKTVADCGHFEQLILTVNQAKSIVVDDTICEGMTYEYADKDVIFGAPLDKTGTYVGYTENPNGCRDEVRLRLVVANPTRTITDTICEGESYTFAGKTYNTSVEVADTIKAVDACDTVVRLKLTVMQKYFKTTKMVCEGTEFQWGDTTLTTSGHYERIRHREGKCDSVLICDFTVLPANVYIDSTICYGQTVKLGTATFNTTGEHQYKFENALKCDSTVHLNLTVTPPDTIRMTAVACEGRVYEGNGFVVPGIDKDTVLMRSDKDDEGCVSVTLVNVDFVETIEVYDTVEIKAGGSYTFCGNSYNTAGTYTCTRETADGCDSITYLTLIVSTGVENVAVRPVVLAPNPIGVNDVTYIHRTWSAEEQHGLTVEIINSVGKILSSEKPEYYPIAIQGLSVSGVYYIRITTGTGDVYMGKLIVR